MLYTDNNLWMFPLVSLNHVKNMLLIPNVTQCSGDLVPNIEAMKIQNFIIDKVWKNIICIGAVPSHPSVVITLHCPVKVIH